MFMQPHAPFLSVTMGPCIGMWRYATCCSRTGCAAVGVAAALPPLPFLTAGTCPLNAHQHTSNPDLHQMDHNCCLHDNAGHQLLLFTTQHMYQSTLHPHPRPQGVHGQIPSQDAAAYDNGGPGCFQHLELKV